MITALYMLGIGLVVFMTFCVLAVLEDMIKKKPKKSSTSNETP